MDLEAWLAKNRHLLADSPYEVLFVTNVLSRLPELDVTALRAQLPFVDDGGRSRYCDFVIQEGTGVRIAIEVDGFDKRGTGQGMTKWEFVDWQRRQASLVALGWRVIRFANTDVRDEPGRCAELLGLLLREVRTQESHSLGLEQRIRELERDSARRVAEQRADYGENTAGELNRLRGELLRAKQAAKLSDTERQRLHELEQTQLVVQALEKEASIMKTTIWALTALMSVLRVLFFLGRPAGTGSAQETAAVRPPSAETALEREAAGRGMTVHPRAAEPTSLAGSSCSQPLPWSEARGRTGSVVAIAGPVTRVAIRDDVSGRPVFMTVGQPFPSRQRVDLVIWGRDRARFQTLLDAGLEGRDVCVFARIDDRNGVPQIVLGNSVELQLR